MSKAFRGTINIDIKDSKPDWEPYTQPSAPEGSPNVVYIVLDVVEDDVHDIGRALRSGRLRVRLPVGLRIFDVDVDRSTERLGHGRSSRRSVGRSPSAIAPLSTLGP